MGYNYGARKKARGCSRPEHRQCNRLRHHGGGYPAILDVPRPLLRIFDGSDEMLPIGVPALRIISLSFTPQRLRRIFSTLFQAVGRGKNSLLMSALRQLSDHSAARLPVDQDRPAAVCGIAFPLAEIISLVASLLLFSRFYKLHIHNLENKPASPAV